MHIKTIRRGKNRIEVYRESELVNIAIMNNGDIKIQEIILRRNEIAEINKWINK